MDNNRQNNNISFDTAFKHIQTGGGPDAENCSPPLQTSKNVKAPPPFAVKITGQPHRKTCKLNFY